MFVQSQTFAKGKVSMPEINRDVLIQAVREGLEA